MARQVTSVQTCKRRRNSKAPIDGSIALVGASGTNTGTGATYVFVRSGATWTQQQKLTASDATKNDGFGSAVSLSADGNTALVGATMMFEILCVLAKAVASGRGA